jgi:hypothetical protein
VCGDGVIDLDSGEECDPGDAATGCTPTCVVDCPAGALVDPVAHHCYFPGPTVQKQDTANDYCRSHGGHLVTFTSEEELTLVAAWKGWPEDGGVWVGLALAGAAGAYTSSALAEPGWPAPPETVCSGCYAHLDAGGDANFPAYVQADGGDLRGSCVIAAKAADQPWHEFPCDTIVPVVSSICEREPPGSLVRPCAGNVYCVDSPSTVGKKRYVYHYTPATGDDAKVDCQSLGGSLAILKSREERDQLGRELGSLATSDSPLSFWIGLSISPDGVATWDDGAPITTYPLPWGDHEPAIIDGPGRAAMRLSLGKYDTQLAHVEAATEKLAYVCEL